MPAFAHDAPLPPQQDVVARARQALTRGDHPTALRLLKGHVQRHPQDERGWLGLAMAQRAAGNVEEAKKAISHVSSGTSLLPEEQFDLGALRLEWGDIEGARPFFDAVAGLGSAEPATRLAATLGLARCELHAQRPEAALAVLLPWEATLAQAPTNAQASWHFLRGTAHLKRQEWPLAARFLGKCLARDPRHVPALNNLGVVLKEGLRDREAAKATFRQVLEADPTHLDAAINLAALLMDGSEEELREAKALLHHYAESRPAHTLYWHALGQVLHRLREWPQALQAYQNSLELDPGNADAMTNVGLWFFDQKQYETAITWFRRALAVESRHADALNFLGVSLSHIGRLEDHLPILQELIAQDPNQPNVRFQLAWNLLGTGQFGLGFENYRFRPSRHERHGLPNGLGFANTLPPDMQGDRLLVVQDQGIGDEWFFLRFVPQLAARGARLSYYTESKIAGLIQRLGWFEQVYTALPPAEAFAAAINIGDLPWLLGMQDQDTVPPPVPIAPLGNAVERARIILRAYGPPPYVGVTWQGGTNLLREKDGPRKRLLDKSIPIEALAAWLPAGATVVSLQRKPLPGEVSQLAQAIGRPVLDAAMFNDDLEAMLGLLSHLDHYYAVSNANVHLAASLGLPCTIFVPQPPEWRWLIVGDSSPWFPGMRIVRQRPGGEWPTPEPHEAG
jgi:tetratricopeptide (TPR) repeat protein